MVIGIDLRALQTGHKFRGIGEVTKQTVTRILGYAAAQNENRPSFIFYEYDDPGNDPKDLLHIPSDIKYEVVSVGPMPEKDTTSSTVAKARRNLKMLYGQPINDSKKSDVFLQFDYAFGVPTNTRTVLVKHDIIPYIFWDKYFESAWVPFKNKAARTTLRTIFANHKYLQTLRRSIRNATSIIAVSGNTKKDIEKHFHVSPKKTKVAHLGVEAVPSKTNETAVSSAMPTKPYLLFIGAGDARRRVDDLVAAFNNLKASGRDIQLVLVGENFQKQEHIPNKNTRDAVLKSSYKNDILTLGYVDDATKHKLFQEAVAYVYPTKYEGFGIPVLEAMLHGCPVVTYSNSSIPEVGGEFALYAKDWSGIQARIEELLEMPEAEKNKITSGARRHAEAFTWDRTSQIIYDELVRQGML